MYGTPNYVLEIIIRIIWWRRMNVYMFRRVLSIEAIKRVNNLLIQYVIVLVPVVGVAERNAIVVIWIALKINKIQF